MQKLAQGVASCVGTAPRSPDSGSSQGPAQLRHLELCASRFDSPSGVIRSNRNDKEKISTAPARERRAQTASFRTLGSSRAPPGPPAPRNPARGAPAERVGWPHSTPELCTICLLASIRRFFALTREESFVVRMELSRVVLWRPEALDCGVQALLPFAGVLFQR